MKTRSAAEVLKAYLRNLADISLDGDDSDFEHLAPKARDNTLAALHADVLAIVGEDNEKHHAALKYDTGYWVGRNELRAELRQALARYFGQEATE